MRTGSFSERGRSDLASLAGVGSLRVRKGERE